jgi:hypothetical protein
MERVVESADPGIFDGCHSEYSSLAEVWILPQEKSIGHDGADREGYSRDYKVFLRLYGANDLKNGPKGAI